MVIFVHDNTKMKEASFTGSSETAGLRLRAIKIESPAVLRMTMTQML